MTDANLLVGHLDPDRPLAGGVALDRNAAERAVARLAAELGETVEDTATGILRVANAEMAGAVRVMTVERGVDPRELALLAFGGAGPLHAVGVAEELGIRRVVVPRASGVLSALGLVVSERRSDAVESVLLTGEELMREAVSEVVERLARRGRDALGTDAGEVRASFDLRYAGQGFELTVGGDPRPDPEDLRAAFERVHEDRYGYSDETAEVELVTVRVAVVLPGGEPGREGSDTAGGTATGPAVVDLEEATLVVPEGWSAGADEAGTWIVERAA